MAAEIAAQEPFFRLFQDFGPEKKKARMTPVRGQGDQEARKGVLLGCGALSAECDAGPIILGYFLFLGCDTGCCRNPFA